MIPNEFIEVTCLNDGKKALIRIDLIDAVYEYGATQKDYGIKPAHTEICYDSNKSCDCVETYEEVCNMMWRAEL